MTKRTCVMTLLSLLILSGSTAMFGEGAVVITAPSPGPANDTSIMMKFTDGTVIAFDPQNMKPDPEPDAILVTHGHHMDNSGYYAKFPDAVRNMYKVKSLDVNGVHIEGVAASHTAKPVNTKRPNFVFYVLEADGLRIAYFSCLGQKEFTSDQLTALGKIDVALITADDYPGWISVDNAVGLMKQLNPQIIIPLSHHNSDIDAALKKMGATGASPEIVHKEYMASKDLLSGGERKIIRILKK